MSSHNALKLIEFFKIAVNFSLTGGFFYCVYGFIYMLFIPGGKLIPLILFPILVFLGWTIFMAFITARVWPCVKSKDKS